MREALPGPRSRPRPLPAGEPLSADDYRRLVGVLEAVDRATDLPMFRERLLRALQSWFGFAGVAVLHGDSLAEAVRNGCGARSGYSDEFLEEYAARWIDVDPFRGEHAFELLPRLGVATIDDVDTDPDRRFVERFLKPYGIHGKIAMVIDGGAAGVFYVGMAVRDTASATARDLAVFRTLRRHLAPLVADQLARYREQTASRSAWKLTPREWDVARLAAQGLTNVQIAERLFVGVDTVKKHLTRVLAETGCASRTVLAVRWRHEAQHMT